MIRCPDFSAEAVYNGPLRFFPTAYPVSAGDSVLAHWPEIWPRQNDDCLDSERDSNALLHGCLLPLFVLGYARVGSMM